MSQTLLNISDDLLALRDALEAAVDEHGEIDEVAAKQLEDWFAALTMYSNIKIDNYIAVIKDNLYRAQVRREEADRLLHRAKVDETLAVKLKERLMLFMTTHNLKRLETARYKLTVARNGGLAPMTVPDDVNALPEQCVRVVRTPDNVVIRNLLAAGVPVPGCSLGERGSHIRIS